MRARIEKAFILGLGICLGLTRLAFADVAFQYPNGKGGTLIQPSFPAVEGNKFQVKRDLVVTALAYEVDTAVTNTEPTAIFDINGAILSVAYISPNDVLSNGYYWQAVAPLILKAGNSYYIGSLHQAGPGANYIWNTAPPTFPSFIIDQDTWWKSTATIEGGGWNHTPPARNAVSNFEYHLAGSVLQASHTFFGSNFDLSPYSTAVVWHGDTQTSDAYIAGWAQFAASNSSGGTVVSMTGGTQLDFGAGVLTKPGLLPVAIANNAAAGSPPDLRLLGKQSDAFGIKPRYFGGGTNTLSGTLDYEYTSDGFSYDQVLGMASYPYADYACSAVKSVGLQSFGIFSPPANGGGATVRTIDSTLAPTSVAFGGNLILAAGHDNSAGPHGGARASCYSINGDGSVSLVFTKTVANTLVNHVFTAHSLMWAGLSGTFNVVADNQKVHDATGWDDAV